MKVVIVGNGVSGNSVAERIRSNNKDIDLAIIAEENYPEYSACVLAKYLCREVDEKAVFLKSFDDYERLGIETILGEKVETIYPYSKVLSLSNGKYFAYDKLVIATGSQPFIPKVEEIYKNIKKRQLKKGIFTFKTFSDIVEILSYKPSKVAIVGSGPIGIEAAVSLRKNGCRVFLIEALERILPRLFDREASKYFSEDLKRNNVEIFTHEKVLKNLGKDKVEGILTDKREIVCDVVIFATGMRPNIILASGSGIDIGETGGIKVDNFLETNVKDIYACGDCIETQDLLSGEIDLNQLWLNAKMQGEIVGCNILGYSFLYPGSETFMALSVFDYHGVSYGQTLDWLKSKNYGDIRIRYLNDSKDGFLKLIIINEKLRGIQAVGDKRFVGTLIGFARKGSNFSEMKEHLINHDSLIKRTLINYVYQKYTLV